MGKQGGWLQQRAEISLFAKSFHVKRFRKQSRIQEVMFVTDRRRQEQASNKEAGVFKGTLLPAANLQC